jgi:alkanesulfonate monooxygenase SsuD/methylene tetrahydromethanopterin reductase-like flavin-dependent oxidoreductase (luciferase family)
MDFGLFSQHHRPSRGVADAYEEDLVEVVTADQLGYREAWISEHAFPAELFISKAAGLTRSIRLGPGVRPLAIHHPLQVAIEANACDQLTRGRYQFGFGLGGPLGGPRKMEQRGLGDDTQRRARMWESIEFIRRAWTSSQPFDFEGTFWQGTGIKVEPPPFQLPHPPIAISTGGSRETLETAGREGFSLLLGSNDDAESVSEMLVHYSAAGARAGFPRPRDAVRLSRLVYVAPDTRQAIADLRATLGAQVESERELLRQQLERAARNGQAEQASGHDSVLRTGRRVLAALGSDRPEAITLEALVECGYYLVGDPDTVSGHLRRLFGATGGFGTLLLLAGRDLGSREGRLRSLRLFMEQVAPGLRDLAPPATELAEAGVAGGGLQAERGGELFGTEPDAARKRGPGAAVEGQPRP